MFRPIRKKKNGISTDAAEELLLSARRGVLAMNGDEGYPYAIPINYLYDRENRTICFHGSRIGHKADALKNSDKVCFTVIGNEAVKEEAWAPFVRSVVVFGRCAPVDDPEKAAALLKRFAMKYYPCEQAAEEEIAVSGRAVRMYEIRIEHFSGKEVQER